MRQYCLYHKSRGEVEQPSKGRPPTPLVLEPAASSQQHPACLFTVGLSQ